MVEPVSYGARIKAARNKLGFSVEKFAEVVGVARSTQMNYESGRTLPTIDYLDKCLAAGALIADLLPAAAPPREKSNIVNCPIGELPVSLHAALERHLPGLRAGGATTPLYEELWHLFQASLTFHQK